MSPTDPSYEPDIKDALAGSGIERGGHALSFANKQKLAKQNGVNIDVAVSPFLTEGAKKEILEVKAQDPEWD